MNILAHVTRGNISESRHTGFIAVADAHGQPLFTSGPLEEDRVSFMRSAAKPIQATALVESGAADRFGLTQSELALACSSHNGQEEHTRLVQSMLDKGGLKPEQLLCGSHWPLHVPTSDKMKAEGQIPTNLHSNCSGKHTGMLLTCLHMGWPTENYTEPEHPLQELLLKTMGEFTGLRPAEIATGRDGCSVVCFGMTTVQMATSFARLAQPDYWREIGRSERAESVQRLTEAMRTYPFNVAGSGRADTDLMEAAPGGRIFSKGGAEAVWCMGFPEKGWGLAFKVEDGSARAEAVIGAEALRQTGLLNKVEIDTFASQQVKPLRNVRGIEIGQYQPTFELRAPERWNDEG